MNGNADSAFKAMSEFEGLDSPKTLSQLSSICIPLEAVNLSSTALVFVSAITLRYLVISASVMHFNMNLMKSRIWLGLVRKCAPASRVSRDVNVLSSNVNERSTLGYILVARQLFDQIDRLVR